MARYYRNRAAEPELADIALIPCPPVLPGGTDKFPTYSINGGSGSSVQLNFHLGAVIVLPGTFTGRHLLALAFRWQRPLSVRSVCIRRYDRRHSSAIARHLSAVNGNRYFQLCAAMRAPSKGHRRGQTQLSKFVCVNFCRGLSRRRDA